MVTHKGFKGFKGSRVSNPNPNPKRICSVLMIVKLLCFVPINTLLLYPDDGGDGDSDVESKDLDLPLRDPISLRTDKKFDDAYVSQKELGK